MKKPLVILSGPTAVGKTSLSVKLAELIDAEIISADSMQIYRGMNIGSAKITESEMQGIPHHLIDSLDFDQDFNVAAFKELAKAAIADIHSRGKIPLIVGGTGFYIQAVIKDIDFSEGEVDDLRRRELYELAEVYGPEKLHKILADIDPKAAQSIHSHNIKRVIRAIEYAESTGGRISDHNNSAKQKESPYNYAYFVLNRDRSELYERIERRVDKMIQNGLVDEVSALKEKGATSCMTSMQGLGYKEILDYLDGLCDLDTAIKNIKLGTRHFAKRQITWFKREQDVIWLDAGDHEEDELLEIIHKILRDRDIAR